VDALKAQTGWCWSSSLRDFLTNTTPALRATPPLLTIHSQHL